MKLDAPAVKRTSSVLEKVCFVLVSLLILFTCAPLSDGHCARQGPQNIAPGHAHQGRTQWTETHDAFNSVISDVPAQGIIKVFEQKVRFENPRLEEANIQGHPSDVDTSYDRVHMKGLAKWDGEAGAPLLPVKPLRILVPYNHRVIKVKVFKGQHETIEGEFLVEPAQEPIPLSHSDKAKPTPPNPHIYESDTGYPLVPCGDAIIQKMHGYTVLTLNLFPVEYHPKSKKVSYYPQMRIQVSTHPLNEMGNHPWVDQAYADEVRDLVENPDVLATYSEESVTSSEDVTQGEASGLPDGAFEYVVITNNSLRDAAGGFTFQDLVSTKTARDLTATIVTVEDDIYPYYLGTENGDNADKIRQFIAEAYVNWGTRWVLLGGDTEIIPKRGVYASSGSYVQTSLPTDLYYACLDGPWNGDGDGYWGEYNDGANSSDIDFSAEIYIGRASVSNASELSNFVAKTIQYETISHSNEMTAISLGEKLDDNTWGSYSGIPIKDQCLPNEWDVVERYDSSGGWSGSTFINDLNASPHIVNHLGHANATYNARINNSNVAALSNDDPYVMYSQGCNSGSFDTQDRAIAEQHIVSTGGAVAVVMNARYGWYSPGTYPAYSHYYALEFWDAAFNESKIHFGQTNQDARDDNLFRVGSTGTYRWIHFETNLFGDPETSFHLPPPTPPSEIHGMVVDDDDGNGVNDEDEFGVEGELVFLDSNNNGTLDNGEPSTTSGTDGRYTFTDLVAGTYFVRHRLSPYWEHTSSEVHEVNLAEDEVMTGKDFLMIYNPPLPPAPPTGLSASPLSESEINLNWSYDSDDETGFKIERSRDDINYSEIAQVDQNFVQYSDWNLLSDTQYYYRVRSFNDGGDSDYSNIASATTDSPVPPQITVSYVKPPDGKPGDGLRIGGSNFGKFDSLSGVLFVEVTQESEPPPIEGNAPIVLWKDGLIKCKVPALQGGEYWLTVVTGFGESDPVLFTISSSDEAPPPPPEEEISITSLSTSQGSPGTSLRIKGVNFGNGGNVMFIGGGIEKAAPVSLWKDGQIKCSVPDFQAAGTYSVKVVVGSSESNEVNFTVVF